MNDPLDCKAVSRLLSDAQDRPLPVAQRQDLEAHLRLCDACREIEQQFALLGELLRRLRA